MSKPHTPEKIYTLVKPEEGHSLHPAQKELLELQSEHRDLDEIISKLSKEQFPEKLKIQRLKKRKLKLKDKISFIHSKSLPNIIA